MAKKTLDDFYGPGVLSGRGNPLPHMAGYASAGAEGPKRLMPKGKKPKVTAPEGPKQSMPVYRDKYGRRISKAEYEKRQGYRSTRSGQTADTAERNRSGEMKRRKKYRKTQGKAAYGSGATTKTRNQDLALGVSSRYVNKKSPSERAKYKR